ncbi:MAG: class I SAM-dependent methyltransferase [Nitrospirae bacterium]|nr:class I SAM-dependent methyltransferase [Nitrospirota bacterium]
MAYPAERIPRLLQMHRTHFWFLGRRVLVREILKRYGTGGRALELGCGGGGNLDGLNGLVSERHGLDRHRDVLSHARQYVPRVHLVEGDCQCLPYQEGAFHAVLMLDLLEHVDDRHTLKEAFRVLRPGGIAVASCPAWGWLWSGRDEAAGHMRRYTRRGIQGLFVEAGLEVLHTRYYQCLLFPLVVASRLLNRWSSAILEREERPGRWVNGLFARINTLEVRLGAVLPWPWGSSIVVVGRKP